MSEDPKDAIWDLVYGLRAERDAARAEVERLRECLGLADDLIAALHHREQHRIGMAPGSQYSLESLEVAVDDAVVAYLNSRAALQSDPSKTDSAEPNRPRGGPTGLAATAPPDHGSSQ